MKIEYVPRHDLPLAHPALVVWDASEPDLVTVAIHPATPGPVALDAVITALVELWCSQAYLATL